ncbi:MAG TPA: TIGR03619 family F420-dependent LLM class oxidoreductase [Acidimicrobiia bacterium]
MFELDWLSDLGTLREAAQAYDEAGLDYVTFGGHLLTARPERYPDRPLATYGVPFRDPFVLYANLAAITQRLRFRTSIFIMPLFPTVLVAKQAADLSLLSGGRFDLGVGISWQEAEYQAMGSDFRNRGVRMTEQLELLRRLWTEPLVTFNGRFHQLDEVGIGQLPTKPVPIWVGCGSEEHLLERVGRLADGWMPLRNLRSPEDATRLRRIAEAAGRSEQIGVATGVSSASDDEVLVSKARSQQAAGATALTISVPPGSSPSDGMKAVTAARQTLASALA